MIGDISDSEIGTFSVELASGGYCEGAVNRRKGLFGELVAGLSIIEEHIGFVSPEMLEALDSGALVKGMVDGDDLIGLGRGEKFGAVKTDVDFVVFVEGEVFEFVEVKSSRYPPGECQSVRLNGLCGEALKRLASIGVPSRIMFVRVNESIMGRSAFASECVRYALGNEPDSVEVYSCDFDRRNMMVYEEDFSGREFYSYYIGDAVLKIPNLDKLKGALL